MIVDASPHFEGRVLMRKLVQAGIPCTYLLINAVNYVIRNVTKVILGAFAFMSNGNAMSRVGTAAVAMIAHLHQVPVIFCCEIYKFCDRAHLDSICYNEVAQPDDMLAAPGPESQLRHQWRNIESLQVLNLVYDLTPCSFIDMIITESGVMPPTSVPVILREMAEKET